MPKGFSWDDNPDLNITPLVDVMLVLMAILMITAPVIVFEEKITLPQGSNTHQVVQKEPLSIKIDANKTVYFDKERFGLKQFADELAFRSATLDKNQTVSLFADEKLSYKDVMHLLKIIKDVGFYKVSLATQ